VFTVLSTSLSVYVTQSIGGICASVSRLIVKKPSVQACVLSFQPASHHAKGVLFTQIVTHAQIVVNIPAGWNHIANVSTVHWFQRE
jgi:hypothetical protein